MNLGNRRIRNDELREIFQSLGFSNVEIFLASGNVIFDAEGDTTGLQQRIETGLRNALSYEVPTFVRTADEIRDIAEHMPFDAATRARSQGKLQVMLLKTEPQTELARQVMALASGDDPVAFRGRELYWLPKGRMSDSLLPLPQIDRALGGTTMRTRTTLERICNKYL
jgi:uncharacterized protein (DUF1697 family)